MRRILQLAALSTLLFSAGAARAGGESYLFPNEYLYPGQQIVVSCYYRLVMQTDGNLVLYSRSTPLWASNTVGRGGYATMQSDGNLVVYGDSGRAVWASNTAGNAGAYLVLQGDRNLVIYSAAGRALWASNTVDRSGVGVAIQPCNWESAKTSGYNGYDLAGGDIGYVTYGILTQNHCAYQCLLVPGCVAYTYVPAGYQDPTRARCWVKSWIANGYSVAPSDFFSGQVIRASHYDGNL